MTPEEWVASVVPTLRVLIGRNQHELITVCFRMPGDGAFCLQVIRHLSMEEQYSDVLSLGINSVLTTMFPQIEAYAGQLCTEGGFDKGYVTALKHIYSRLGSDLASVLAPAQQRMSTSPVGLSELEGLMLMLSWLVYQCDSQVARATVESTINGNYMGPHVENAVTQNAWSVAALCILPAMIPTQIGINLGANQSLDISQRVGLLQDGGPGLDPLADALAGSIVEYGLVDKLMASDITEGIMPELTNRVIDCIVKRGPGNLSRQLALDKYEMIAAALPKDALVQFYGHHIAASSLLVALEGEAFGARPFPLYETCYLAMPGEQVEKYEDFLRKGLLGIGKDRWDEALLANSPLLQLVVFLVDRKVGIGLQSPLADALISEVERLLPSTDRGIHVSREKALGVLSDDWQKSCLKGVLDLLMKKVEEVDISDVLSVYGDHLLQSLDDLDSADSIVRDLFTPIIRKGDAYTMGWMCQAVSGASKAVRGCKKEWRNILKERIKEKLGDSALDPEQLGVLKDIAKALRVKED